MGFWFILFTCFIVSSEPHLNPYKVLKISRWSTADEIKKAYQNLAGIFHPDKAGIAQRPDFEERMRKINKAYHALTDSAQKVKVDQSLSEFVRFTQENFKFLVTKQDIWVIYIYSHWCRDCPRAKEVTKKACAHLEGIVNCGSISSDSELILVHDLRVQRTPAILFRVLGETWAIPFSRHRTEPSNVIKAVSQKFPTAMKEIKKLRYIERFLENNPERLKAIFISETRTTPNMMHRWLGHKFRDRATFCFVPLKSFHSSELTRMEEIIGEKIDVPMLALFEGSDLPPTVVRLTNDPEQMFYRLESTFERLPRIPKLQASEYYNRCYSNIEDGLFDASKICILLLLSKPSLWADYQKKLVPIAKEHDATHTQFIWVECKKESLFCNEWTQGSRGSNMFVRGSTLRIVGVLGPQNIHSLCPVLTKQPDLLDQEQISNWVSNFAKKNWDEIEIQHGLCTLPASDTTSLSFDLSEDSWLQTLSALGTSTTSTTSNIISSIINFFVAIFFLLLFLLVMCVASGDGANIRFRV